MGAVELTPAAGATEEDGVASAATGANPMASATARVVTAKRAPAGEEDEEGEWRGEKGTWALLLRRSSRSDIKPTSRLRRSGDLRRSRCDHGGEWFGRKEQITGERKRRPPFVVNFGTAENEFWTSWGTGS
jgi:hypothetical protein